MASYYGINSNYSSSFFADFFGSSSSANTSSTGNNNTLSDYGLIRSGAYKKLVSAYYDKQTSSSNDTDEAGKKALQLTKGDAKSLYNTTSALMHTEFKAGNEDKVLNNVKAFVEDYNSFIESAAGVDSKSVLQKTVWLTNTASAYSKVLNKAGITIGSDNKLELDEEALKTANLSDVKSIFTGSNSFADQVFSKSNQIYNLASQGITGSTSSTYTSTGGYSALTTSTIYVDMF